MFKVGDLVICKHAGSSGTPPKLKLGKIYTIERISYLKGAQGFPQQWRLHLKEHPSDGWMLDRFEIYTPYNLKGNCNKFAKASI